MKKTESANANGTYLQGYVSATYSELHKVFGNPNYGPDDDNEDKVTCEWVLEYEDNKYCTIYDWKLGKTPYSEYMWHIGGNEIDCVEAIKVFLKGTNDN